MSENDYIFIGGTMRSGTSLTRAILGSNPRVAVYPRDIPLWGFYEKYPKVIKEKEDWIKVIDEILAHKKAGYVSKGYRDSAIKHFEESPFDLPEFIRYFIDRYAEKLYKEIPALKTPKRNILMPNSYIDQEAFFLIDEFTAAIRICIAICFTREKN
jgi:hypothetical protein